MTRCPLERRSSGSSSPSERDAQMTLMSRQANRRGRVTFIDFIKLFDQEKYNFGAWTYTAKAQIWKAELEGV